jgi:hypothetical protein
MNGDVFLVNCRREVAENQVVPQLETVTPEIASDVRAEASRQRRNRRARERHDAMRSLGLVKTPYGWE